MVAGGRGRARRRRRAHRGTLVRPDAARGLVAVQRTTALHASPPWQRGVRVLLLAGFAVFVGLVAVEVWTTATELFARGL
ncbi:hypothetical protein ACFQL1_08365 [Halomicroarcula sp. GCM10025709]|uniref:hypothetical protein n=1 Tax=Halomicroarcula sp. GCM10025709 TaxID=3252669 RepID=UPI00361EF24E